MHVWLAYLKNAVFISPGLIGRVSDELQNTHETGGPRGERYQRV